MSQRYRAVLILAAALAVTGCGTATTTTATGTRAATAAASASQAPGCAQAAAAVTAARHAINARDYPGAVTRISDLRDTLPRGALQVDAALAAVKLAFLSADAATPGSAVYQDVKDALAALDKIGADCGEGR